MEKDHLVKCYQEKSAMFDDGYNGNLGGKREGSLFLKASFKNIRSNLWECHFLRSKIVDYQLFQMVQPSIHRILTWLSWFLKNIEKISLQVELL